MLVNAKKLLRELVKVAHELAEQGYAKESDTLLRIAHDLGAQTLAGAMPDTALLGSLQALLADQSIRFAIIGAMAVGVYGLARFTDDIDVLVTKLPTNTTDADYMRRFGFYKAKSSTGTVMVIDHRKDGYVELLKATSKLDKFALTTAVEQSILKHAVPVVTPEALIYLKTHAMLKNPDREHKDSIDILNVYKKVKPALKHINLLNEQEQAKLKELLHL